MSDTVREWNAEQIILGAFWRISQAFWPPKLAKSGLKGAPQRRGYTLSLAMGPIDGTHGCPQKRYFHFAPDRLIQRLSR
eukprot:gene23371-biopygen10331